MKTKLIVCVLALVGFTSFKPLYHHSTTNSADSLAGKYPSDIGIEQDPDVLYVEKFDDGMANILDRYTDVLNGEGMSLDYVDVPSKGSVAIKMTNQGGESDGGHLFRQFNPGFDSTIYMCLLNAISLTAFLVRRTILCPIENQQPSPRSGLR